MILDLGLHVSCLKSYLSILVRFEADEAGSVFLQINGSRANCTEWGEKSFEFSISEVVRKVLDE